MSTSEFAGLSSACAERHSDVDKSLPCRGSYCRICTSSTHSAGNQPVLPFTVPSQKPPSPILSTVGRKTKVGENEQKKGRPERPWYGGNAGETRKGRAQNICLGSGGRKHLKKPSKASLAHVQKTESVDNGLRAAVCCENETANRCTHLCKKDC